MLRKYVKKIYFYKNINIMDENQLLTTSEINKNDENYEFKTNVNRSLCKVLNIDEIKDFELSDYEPPKEHGLSNCIIIIPKYLNLDKNLHKIFDIDYYEIIKDRYSQFKSIK